MTVERSIAPVLRDRFAGISSLENKIGWVEQNPHGWERRIQEFDEVINVMNLMLHDSSRSIKGYHRDIQRMRDKRIKSLPTLSELLSVSAGDKGPSKEVTCRLINNTFRMVKNQMSAGGAWEWVTQISDPFQALSGLLIEGYGQLLSYLHDGDPELKRQFVQAFEEALWTENKARIQELDQAKLRKEDDLSKYKGGFRLLNDVMLWMVEERDGFPRKIAKEVMQDNRYGRNFGFSDTFGDDPYFFDASPEEKLKILGWSQACPNPEAVAEKFTLDWTIRRYAECNFWNKWIWEQTEALNPELAKALKRPIVRPTGEGAGAYHSNYVPHSYEKAISPMSTPWGYALSRVLIEQFGRGARGESDARTPERILRGLNLLDQTVRVSKTPAELLARLSNKVVYQGSAKDEAVLGHVLAQEMAEEGKMFLMKEVTREMRLHAPRLWQKYCRDDQPSELSPSKSPQEYGAMTGLSK